MSYDDYILEFNKTKLIAFEKENQINRLLYGLDKIEMNLFEWNFVDRTVKVSKRLSHYLGIDLKSDVSVLHVSQNVFDNSTQFKFFEAVSLILDGDEYSEVEVPLAVGRFTFWYKIRMTRMPDDSCFIGVIEKIQDLKTAQSQAEGLSLQLNQILESMPMPIYYYDVLGNILFTNNKFSEDFSRINRLIEKQLHGDISNMTDYDWIHDVNVTQYSKQHMIFKIMFRHKGADRNSLIHRVEIFEHKEKTGILYLHEDITDYHTDEMQLSKILKANELIIEIRDIVDHVSDLQSMYSFLLSKIHTVIPAAKRSCILKIDDKDDLYIAASQGFDKSYVDVMRLPFKESFAYVNLLNDYSKSVIIDDIQSRYSEIHPEININQFGFVHESNITTPLVIEGKLYGILSVDSDQNHVFDDVDLNLLDYLKLQIERAIDKFRKLIRVKQHSIMDPLTGIYNRRHLMDMMTKFIDEAMTIDEQFSFVLFDLDKLKAVNDNYGHIVGDMVIKQFAFITNNDMREVDILARIGGDEFVGVYWNIPKSVLKSKLDRLHDLFDQNIISYEGHNIKTKFSYGIATYPEDGNSFETLLSIADKRMYDYKRKKA